MEAIRDHKIAKEVMDISGLFHGPNNRVVRMVNRMDNTVVNRADSKMDRVKLQVNQAIQMKIHRVHHRTTINGNLTNLHRMEIQIATTAAIIITTTAVIATAKAVAIAKATMAATAIVIVTATAKAIAIATVITTRIANLLLLPLHHHHHRRRQIHQANQEAQIRVPKYGVSHVSVVKCSVIQMIARNLFIAEQIVLISYNAQIHWFSIRRKGDVTGVTKLIVKDQHRKDNPKRQFQIQVLKEVVLNLAKIIKIWQIVDLLPVDYNQINKTIMEVIHFNNECK